MREKSLKWEEQKMILLFHPKSLLPFEPPKTNPYKCNEKIFSIFKNVDILIKRKNLPKLLTTQTMTMQIENRNIRIWILQFFVCYSSYPNHKWKRYTKEHQPNKLQEQTLIWR